MVSERGLMIVHSTTCLIAVLAVGLGGCGSKISSLNKAKVQTAWSEKESVIQPADPVAEPVVEEIKLPQDKPFSKPGKWAMHAVGPQAILGNAPSPQEFPVWATVLGAQPSSEKIIFTLGIGGKLTADEGQ